MVVARHSWFGETDEERERRGVPLQPGEQILVRPDGQPAGAVALELPDAGSEERGGRYELAAATFLDSAAVRLAVARDLIPAWTADLLNRVEQKRHYLMIGRSSLKDYAREELGLTPWQLRDARRLGRTFVRLPSLRAAVLAGHISCALALKLASKVATDPEAREAVGALPTKSVRAWSEELDEARAASVDECAVVDDDPPRIKISFRAPASFLPRWRSAIEMVRDMEGADLAIGDAVECVAAEWLSAAPLEDETAEAEAAVPEGRWSWPRRLSILREILEKGTRNWEFLSWARPHATLGEDVERDLASNDDDPHEVHRRLLYLTRLGQELDWQTGRVLSTLKRFGVPWLSQFASFSHYVEERLHMSPRRAYYLVELHRDLMCYPLFDEAYRTGELSWSQAAILARLRGAEDAQLAWLARARAVTVSRLEDEVRWAVDLAQINPPAANASFGYPPLDPAAMPEEVAPPDFDQDCPGVFDRHPLVPRALGMLWPWPSTLTGPIAPDEAVPTTASAEVSISFWLQNSASTLVREALASVRAAAGDPELPEWRAFETMIEHFAETHHESEPVRKMRRRHRVFERDGWRCQMPGCRSSGPLHAHHIVFRSRGGSDDDSNLLTLCSTCHEQLVHRGRAWITGQAPGHLRFGIGLRPGDVTRSYWVVNQRRREYVRGLNAG